MRASKKVVAIVAATAGLLAMSAQGALAASTATITGDAGAPVALTPGVPLTIRNMNVEAVAAVPLADAASYQSYVLDPAGAMVGDTFCWSSLRTVTNDPFYRGNGTYTLVVQPYSDEDCTAADAKPQITFQWIVAAGVAIAQPPGAGLTRPPGSFSDNLISLPFTGNPGASIYEVQYALNGQLNPDGSIAGTPSSGFVNTTTGNVEQRFDTPGVYTLVARAVRGSYMTPWSAPVHLTMVGPFDLTTSFPDQRGPSYSVSGQVREKSARGKITVAIAKGKKGKHFRTLGHAKLSSKATFKLRFHVGKVGWYRLRYSYKGSATVARGAGYESIHITLRRFG
jgi:hypothetical protein